ncbi:hypothetical protein P7C73_g5293, partial [Tremellales sp. Uapishka_1]
MMVNFLPIFPLLLLLRNIDAFPTADLRHRSIYQVLTDRFATPDNSVLPCDPADKRYCGGGWKGIENHLDYIQGMGFDTIWISPIVANIPGGSAIGESYHGYWASDIFEINARFGTKQDLADLSSTLHQRGMYLMVDVAVNHLGASSPQNFLAKADYGPFNRPEYFHDFALVTDWEDRVQREQCWIGQEMPDLDTEHPFVIHTLLEWIADLVREYQIDALRIDTVKHIRMDFWPEFVDKAGVACMGEVLHGDPVVLAGYQRDSMRSLLDFATMYALKDSFRTPLADMSRLAREITKIQRVLPDPTLLGSFLDTHDEPRFAGGVADPTLVENAAVYPFINDGFPIMYQGTEHGLRGGNDPLNREAIWLHGYDQTTPRYLMFQALNAARRAAAASNPEFYTTTARTFQLNNNSLVVSKAPLLALLNNYGRSSPIRTAHLDVIKTSYGPSLLVIDVLSKQIYLTDKTGGLSIPIENGEPRVFLPLSVFKGISPKEEWSMLAQPIRPRLWRPTPSGRGGRPQRKTTSWSGVLGWFGVKHPEL